ncbi:hypothetical protein EMPS_06556 [Entomortierella parvispora]|uniref:F-box domain-containing protein n=1 Tax=Entomortierella parvispora TaxID=205924 RepID=A0A9P3LXK5_9FUNG|nr:hypothetical protein EMPS_06556 [Entomortierella parvispora]
MELPNEIWWKVAQYFTLNDKAVSVLVCKSWNQIFITQLYEAIDLRPQKKDQKEKEGTPHQEDSIATSSTTNSNSDKSDEPKSMSMTTIQKYGHLVRELKICVASPYLRELPPSVNGLLLLHLESPPGEEDVVYDSLDRRGLARLLITNPQIQHIFFDKLMYKGAYKLFRQVAKCCQQLESLEVLNSFFKLKDMQSVIQKNPHLSLLAITNVNQYCCFSTPTPKAWQEPFPRLGALTLSLFLDENVKSLGPDEYVQLMCSIPIIQLKVVDYMYEENELTDALHAWPNVQNLILWCSGFGPRSMSALGKHFDHLHTLDLVNSVEFLTWMCEVVLAACPNLVDLGLCFVDLSMLLEEVIEDGKEPGVVSVMKLLNIKVDNVRVQSWACTRLQRFRAASLVWPGPIEMRKRAMNQFLALKHLKHLQFEEVIVLTERSSGSGSDAKIFWKEGDFERREIEQDMETKWMTEAWPDLQTFRMMARSFDTVMTHGIDD